MVMDLYYNRLKVLHIYDISYAFQLILPDQNLKQLSVLCSLPTALEFPSLRQNMDLPAKRSEYQRRQSEY